MTIPTPTRQVESILRRNYLFRFTPQPEITTWELARFVALLVGDKPMHFKAYLALRPELQRHFKHTKNG